MNWRKIWCFGKRGTCNGKENWPRGNPDSLPRIFSLIGIMYGEHQHVHIFPWLHQTNQSAMQFLS